MNQGEDPDLESALWMCLFVKHSAGVSKGPFEKLKNKYYPNI